MIDRKKILSEYSPVLAKVEYHSPLQVGNGQLSFGMDITGFQTFNEEYIAEHNALCTMTQWGWHKTPVSALKEGYLPSDLQETVYDFNGRKVIYPTKKEKGQEEIYDWLRENPHKFNLVQISLENDSLKKSCDIENIYQKLDLFSGKVDSTYTINQHQYHVETVCDLVEDTLAFRAKSEDFSNGKTKIKLFFPYGGSSMSGMQKKKDGLYQTRIMLEDENETIFECKMNQTLYYVKVSGKGIRFVEKSAHVWLMIFNAEKIGFSVQFSEQFPKNDSKEVAQLFSDSQEGWQHFWENVGFVDFTASTNKKAKELQRRVILSQYLLTIQCAGEMPPQETGLLCNSWYGKPHLEMHLWHAAFMPLWNMDQQLERSMGWYLNHQKEASENAQKNHYKGLRWPKMIGNDAIDSPSPIAPLIIWQQSHIIYMLELLYQKQKTTEFLNKYWKLVEGTADFMCDFVQWDAEEKCYQFLPPIFPSQERFDPTKVENPTFEVEYWRFCLKIALLWADRLHQSKEKWKEVYSHFASSSIYNGCYIAHKNCPETFEKVNIDHPSMLGIYGLIENDRIDKQIFKNTLKKVLEVWDFDTTWGWDFGMISMAATRLGEKETALDILLKDTPKNQYEINGHNRQAFRNDLPGYLPGNGALMLAVALMVAGYPDSEVHPGIPENEGWKVTSENMMPFPY